MHRFTQGVEPQERRRRERHLVVKPLQGRRGAAFEGIAGRAIAAGAEEQPQGAAADRQAGLAAADATADRRGPQQQLFGGQGGGQAGEQLKCWQAAAQQGSAALQLKGPVLAGNRMHTHHIEPKARQGGQLQGDRTCSLALAEARQVDRAGPAAVAAQPQLHTAGQLAVGRQQREPLHR